MNLTQLFNYLKATGYPVAYSHFKSEVATPYIVYLSSYSSNFNADDKVYKKVDNIQIELYTDKKDLTAEAVLENTLDANGIVYDSTETYIESEKLFQKLYEVRVI
ncbi:hypothetical protein D3C73_944530 [compost metagenome]